MKTVKDWQGQDRVLVKVFVEQKQTHRVKKNDGTYANLFTGFLDSSLNGWNFKPTVGIALTNCDEIIEGDFIFCPYITFENDALDITITLTKDLYRLEVGEKVFSVSKDQCWFGMRGGELFCIGPNMICKRIYKPLPKSKLTIVADRKKYDNYLYIEKMPLQPEKYEQDEMVMSDLKVGDIIAVKPMSDIEFKYVIDNEHRSLIRANFIRDFLGFTNNSLDYEF